MSFSQAGQDEWVIQILGKKKFGYFLDIGAYDGIHFSNSLLLEQNFNWSGLLVEANKINFELLQKNRPRSTNILCAISDSTGFGVLNNLNMSSKIIAQETVCSPDSVEQMTFTELFQKYNVPKEIDYMSLDIEGYESKALIKFPFHSHICKTLTVEHNLYIDGPNNKNKIKNILLHNDYLIFKENITCDGNAFEDWYIHKSI